MSNMVEKVQPKKVVKFHRVESSLIGTPIVASIVAGSYLLEQDPWFALLTGFTVATLGNFMNYGKHDALLTGFNAKGALSLIPVFGALVPKASRLDEDSPYTFDKNYVAPKKHKDAVKIFLKDNKETRNSWDSLFKTETGENAVDLICDTDSFTKAVLQKDVSIMLHADIINEIEKYGRIREKDLNSMEKIAISGFRKKALRKQGGYVPIHWEYLSKLK